MLPVTTTTSTPNKGATATPQSAPARNHKIIQAQKITDARDLQQKSGDRPKTLASQSPTTKTPQSRYAFVNEPIARSIAGYVVNNIPNKLQTFKWIRATKKDGS